MKKILLLFLTVLSYSFMSAQVTAPYIESFNTNALPTGWSTYATSGSVWFFSGTANSVQCANPGDHTGNAGSYAWLDQSGGDVGNVLEMPVVNVSSLAVPELVFWYHMCGAGYTPPNITVVEAWDGTTWSTVQTINTATSGWEEQSIIVSSFTYGPTNDSIRIRFRAESGGSGSDFFGDNSLDDIEIREAPTCIIPTNLGVNSITATSAMLTWTDNNTAAPAGGWDIELGASGFTPTGTATTNAPVNPHPLSGLIQNTSYDYYVKAVCGPGDSSLWAGPFTFTTLATCPWPTALSATNVTASSADLGWTENGVATAWEIEIGLTGFTPAGVASIPSSVATNPYTLAGLPDNTCFDFYVRSVCGPGDTSVWTGPFTFCTLVAPLACTGSSNATIVFSEEFTTTGTTQQNIPNANAPGWTNTATVNPRWALESNGTSSGSTGPNFGAQGSQGYAYLESSCVNGGTDTLTSPAIDLTAATGAARVKFFNHMFGANSGKLELFIDNGSSLTSVWVDSGQTQASSTAAWDSAVVNLNAYVGQMINLRFVATAANPGGCAGDRGLDQVSVEACLSCVPPTMQTATNTTTTSADLGWTENGAATTWEVENVLTGAAPSGAGVVTMTNPYAQTGLTPASSYDFYVRSICGPGDTSAWTGPFTYLTDTSCVQPNMLTATNIMPTSADLGWTETGTSTNWEIEIVPASTAPTGVGTATTTNPYAATGLTPFTNYEFYVRSVCGAGDSSLWSGPFAFTTPATCIAPSALTVANITGTSADLSWTDNAASPPMGWQIVNQIVGGPFIAGDTTYQAGATPTSLTVTGLTGLTNYEFYVRAVCAVGDTSIWVGPMPYTTMITSLACGPGSAQTDIFYEGFDVTFGTTAPPGWTSVGTGPNWQWDNNTTGSGSTGPSTGALSAGYAYLETSSGAGSDTLITPSIDLTTLTAPIRLLFYHHMYGASMGTLSVHVDDGTTQTQEFTLSGQQQTDELDPWTLESIDLSAYAGSIVNIKFAGLRGGSFTSDMAIDEVAVQACVTAVADMAADSIIAPTSTSGCFTATETVDVLIRNNSLTGIDFSVDPCTVSVDVTGAAIATLSTTLNTGTLAAGATQVVSMTPTLDMTTPGTYNMVADVLVTGDVDVTNDTMAYTAVYTAGLSAISITASPDTICVSGTSTLTFTGAPGATIQWEESTTGLMGPWTPVGTGATTYTTPTLTATTYYRAIASCNSATDSTAIEVFVNNPAIASTTNDTVCGPNSAVLTATAASPTATVNWYTAMTGGTPIAMGDTLLTAVLSVTDTFYAESSDGGLAGLNHTTTYAGGNGSSGNMFPIKALTAITIDSFAINSDATIGFGTDWTISYAPSDYLLTPGANTTAAFWTVIGTVTGVPSNGAGVATVIPLPIGISIPAGQTYSFQIASTNSSVDYTNGTATGNLFNANADLEFYQGHGGNLNSMTFNPRVFNGDIYYTSGCPGNSRMPAIAVVNPSANLALATASNASSTTGNDMENTVQLSGQTYSYHNASCELIATVDDVNNVNLGAVASMVTVDPTVNVWNNQPYTRRWFDITPTNNGPADVTIYQTQADFDDFNAHPLVVNGTWDSLPTSPTDPNTANIRVTHITGGAIGVGTAALITPTATWDPVAMHWALTFPITSFSEFYVHSSGQQNGPLPITLTDFTVTKEGSVSLAAWVTANEENNSHFNLQRSLDGNSFETLGRVNTKAFNGNSSSELNYNFTDESPQIGHNYYRLEQVDLDGQKSFSEVVDLVWGADGSLVAIYPNPATSTLNVDVSIDKVSQLEVRLIDMSGRVVKSVMQKTQKGMNNVTFDLSDIATGVYGVQIYDNNSLIHSTKVNKTDK